MAAAAASGRALELFRGARREVQIRGLGGVVFRDFSSVRAGCFCPAGGKGYYELELLSELTSPQWGFCTREWARKLKADTVGEDPGDDANESDVGGDESAEDGESGDEGEDFEEAGEAGEDDEDGDKTVEKGVGDDGQSWGVDGARICKWHRGDHVPFGCVWRKGDVIGLACELPSAAGGRGRILVSVNGNFSPPNGAAFDLPPGLDGLHPAFSCHLGAVRCNLGGDPARPLRHAPPAPDFMPMAAFSSPPSPPPA